jgi:uncharacterized repeat protein (TIGR02543 family)
MTQAVIPGNFLSPFVPTGGGTFALTVTKVGTGAGTVTGGGINCGTVCSVNVNSGNSVTLTAAAASGSTFAGWTGACTNTTGTCTVSMTQARSVTATFNSQATTFALNVTKNGTGSGTVAGGPINCGATCSANIASASPATQVTLTATPASGSTFAGWSGACTNVTGTCTVTMSAARSVTATFNSSSSFALSITKMGTGTGTVTSSPSGINCGSACNANYSTGTSVTLSQSAATGSTFAGWSGSCTGTGSCVLAMTQSRNVTATFNTSGGTGGTCANPITFTSNTGNFNTTGAVCYRTNVNVAGWGCSSFEGRTASVGGQVRACGQLPISRAADGYYYFSATAGTHPWATFYVWQ